VLHFAVEWADELKNELKQAIAISLKAHQALLSVRTASFDVILSSTGPVILEANYNWSVELLYHVIDINKPALHPAARWLQHIMVSLV